MKNKTDKYFNAVQMVRDIRDAMYRQKFDPKFKMVEFKKKRKMDKFIRTANRKQPVLLSRLHKFAITLQKFHVRNCNYLFA